MSEKGYKVKIRGTGHSHKLPLFCPHCGRPTGTVDDKFLRHYGFCSLCFVNHVDARQTPTIQISEYAHPGGKLANLSEEEIRRLNLTRPDDEVFATEKK